MGKKNSGKNRIISGNSGFILNDLISLIEEYDPNFVFLPAYYVAKKVKEKNDKGKELKEAFNEICEDLKIKRMGRGAKILKVAKKIINSSNS